MKEKMWIGGGEYEEISGRQRSRKRGGRGGGKGERERRMTGGGKGIIKRKRKRRSMKKTNHSHRKCPKSFTLIPYQC